MFLQLLHKYKSNTKLYALSAVMTSNNEQRKLHFHMLLLSAKMKNFCIRFWYNMDDEPCCKTICVWGLQRAVRLYHNVQPTN